MLRFTTTTTPNSSNNNDKYYYVLCCQETTMLASVSISNSHVHKSVITLIYSIVALHRCWWEHETSCDRDTLGHTCAYVCVRRQFYLRAASLLSCTVWTLNLRMFFLPVGPAVVMSNRTRLNAASCEFPKRSSVIYKCNVALPVCSETLFWIVTQKICWDWVQPHHYHMRDKGW